MTSQLAVAKDTWFLGRDGTRRKMRYEQRSTPTLSWFREHSPTDKLAWSTDGRTMDDNEDLRLVMRDHCQYDNYGEVPATVDTGTELVVTLFQRISIDKRTNVITEAVFGGGGMDTETLVGYAYRMNGKGTPDAEGLAFWTGEINRGKWRSILDFLLGISAVFADQKK